MADVPYPIITDDSKAAINQIRLMIDELFQERVAGTNLGDVFTSGDDDVLTLEIANGLEKSASHLQVAADSTGGLQVGANGIAAKIDVSTDNCITKGTAGLKVDKGKIWPIGSIFITTVNTNPNTLLGYGTWVCLGTGDLTLT